jgi:hypothetical protein
MARKKPLFSGGRPRSISNQEEILQAPYLGTGANLGLRRYLQNAL